MRYNPDTERGIQIDDIAAQCRPAATTAVLYPEPKQVWDCQNGRWIDNSRLAETEALAKAEALEGEATLSLWNARYKLQQISTGTIPAATIASLKRDVQDIARELQRLS